MKRIFSFPTWLIYGKIMYLMIDHKMVHSIFKNAYQIDKDNIFRVYLYLTCIYSTSVRYLILLVM